MLYGMMTAGFEDVVEADEVRFDIGVRVGDGVAYARLGGEIDRDLRLVLLEDVLDERLIRQIAFDEGKTIVCRKLLEAMFLQAHIIVIVHGVEADYPRSLMILQYTS